MKLSRILYESDDNLDHSIEFYEQTFHFQIFLVLFLYIAIEIFNLFLFSYNSVLIKNLLCTECEIINIPNYIACIFGFYMYFVGHNLLNINKDIKNLYGYFKQSLMIFCPMILLYGILIF